jgi:hypothetical protein
LRGSAEQFVGLALIIGAEAVLEAMQALVQKLLDRVDRRCALRADKVVVDIAGVRPTRFLLD